MVIKVTRRLFNFFGYEILANSNSRPTDYRDKNLNAMEAYYDNAKRTVVCNINPIECRNSLGLPFSYQCKIHFIYSLRQACTKEESEKVIKEGLINYYNSFNFSNAANFLGLNTEEAPLLADKPSLCYILPWDSSSYENIGQKRFETYKKQALRHGFKLKDNEILDWNQFNINRVDATTYRFRKVICSIKKYGYVRNNGSDGDIAVSLLKNGDNYNFLLRSGGRRICVLAALDYQTIPVRIIDMVSRDEVDYWPQVQRGVITKSGALKYFDRVFRGDPPPS